MEIFNGLGDRMIEYKPTERIIIKNIDLKGRIKIHKDIICNENNSQIFKLAEAYHRGDFYYQIKSE